MTIIMVCHQTARTILTFFFPHSFCGNEWLELTSGPKIFWRPGLMTTTELGTDGSFLPTLWLVSQILLACEGLLLGFSGPSQNCAMNSYRVGRWVKQVWVCFCFHPAWIWSGYSERVSLSVQSKTYLLPSSP